MSETALEAQGDSDENPTAGQLGATRRYWSIHPGDEAKYWQSFKERSHIGVSWGLKHDLKALNSSTQQDLRDWLVINQHLNTDQAAARASQLWNFVYTMQPGDMVCAAGHSRLLGWGEVVGEYEYVLDGQWPEHRRTVQWKSLDSRSAEHFSKPVRNKLTHPRLVI